MKTENNRSLNDDSNDTPLGIVTPFLVQNDNDTIEMVAEQLASLLLDYVQSKRASGFKKLQRRG